MNWKRGLFLLWLAATIAWLAYMATTQFSLLQMGAISLPFFLAAAIGVPVVAFGLGYLVVWMVQGLRGSGHGGGSS